MGSSVVQVHRVGTGNGQVSVDRLGVDINMLHHMTHIILTTDQCLVTRGPKKIVLKFPNKMKRMIQYLVSVDGKTKLLQKQT
jgi:uncharacterized protein with PIN domain